MAERIKGKMHMLCAVCSICQSTVCGTSHQNPEAAPVLGIRWKINGIVTMAMALLCICVVFFPSRRGCHQPSGKAVTGMEFM